MESLSLTTADLLHHVVTFGIDVFPPVEIPKERTRLNMFYEEASSKWGDLYEQLVASEAEFKISKAFTERPGRRPSIHMDTFTLTQRGPVFVFPVLLPEPIGKTGLEDSPVGRFDEVRKLFFSALTDRKIMRVGMVRELVFGTGDTACQQLLATETSFSGSELAGGKSLLVFRDSRCNVRLEFEPLEIRKTIQLPVGARMEQSAGYGVRVQLDVNNYAVRPLEDADIEEVLERATGLWPDELLRYINERSAP